jgi:hypothetical protein
MSFDAAMHELMEALGNVTTPDEPVALDTDSSSVIEQFAAMDKKVDSIDKKVEDGLTKLTESITVLIGIVGQKRKAPPVNGGFKRVHPALKLSPMSKDEENKFLKEHNRCTKCAWTLSENGTHQCTPSQRAMRLRGMRMDPRGRGAKPEFKGASTSA